ncbi:MAG: thioesterase family protein [Deferribacterales bacterium]
MEDIVLECLREVFEIETPFSSFLNIKVLPDENRQPYLFMEMQDVCIGNYMQNILHGGIISTLLDIAGAVVAMESTLSRLNGHPKQDMMKKFEKLGTIDMRVDFLRPGRGKYFVAKGEIMRMGNKISVTRTELRNDENTLIAVGTGTYMVG